MKYGQTKNPYPNVDATSGCVLYHYGLTEFKVRLNDRLIEVQIDSESLLVLYGDLWCF